jgi:hypothetical protein
MTEIGDWARSNWLALGNLLVQCATLAIVVWYGSKILTFLRAFFQYQDEFRERLSVSAVPGSEDDGVVASTWQNAIRWLQEPMAVGSGGSGRFGRVVRWLREPMGS